LTVGLKLPDYHFSTEHKALVIGAGLAGCAIASELARRGFQCTLYDQLSDIAASTSALPVATIQPASSGDEIHSSYFSRAFELCCDQLAPGLFKQCGSLHLIEPSAKKTPQPTNAVRVDAQTASDLAGTKINRQAWHFQQAGFVIPQALCKHWVDNNNIHFKPNTYIAGLRKTNHGWQLLSGQKDVIDESQLVIIANAHSMAQQELCSHIPLQLTKGQIDAFSTGQTTLRKVIHGAGYLVPTANGIWSGATHQRNYTNNAVSDAATIENKHKVLNMTSELTLGEQPLQSFTGVRASSPDRLPVIGALPDAIWYRNNYSELRHGKPASYFLDPTYHKGLYTVTGFGARGATQAIYAARLLADLIACTKRDRARDDIMLEAVHPARFLLRNLRKSV